MQYDPIALMDTKWTARVEMIFSSDYWAQHSESSSKDAKPQTCLDLFCGCGGFSLGMIRAGFEVLAAIDLDPLAIETFQRNITSVPLVLNRDLTKFTPEELAQLLGSKNVDVVVGGPPCQGFSKVRRVDGANNGSRLKLDPRRDLYLDFLRYVQFFNPRIFVMENVLGLRSAVGGEYFTAVQREARALGYRVHSQIEDAWVLGVPQKRRRQLIVGVRSDLPGYFLPALRCSPRAKPSPCLWDAIGDLPRVEPGKGEKVQQYDIERREKLIETRGRTAYSYLYNVLEINRSSKLYNHDARPHSERDLRDFSRLKEGESSAKAMRVRKVQFEFPYDKTHFKDRYTRQSRWEPCSTIVSHLSKDGLMFIHPTQNRSLTPREAARIQGFPDWFLFPRSRTHAYRQIGNAVPPLVAEAVGIAIREFLQAGVALVRKDGGNYSLEKQERDTHTTHKGSRVKSIRVIRRFVNLDRKAIRATSREDLVAGWHALLNLFPDLHPDNALDHGDCVERVASKGWESIDPKGLFMQRFVRSGWPVVLEPLGREVWRRLRNGQLSYTEVYCRGISGVLNSTGGGDHHA